MNGDNMNEYNYTEPLSSEDKAFIMKVLRYLAVELGTLSSEADILSAIKSSGFKCLPRGVLSTMILHGYAKTQGDKIRLVIVDSDDNNKKGGETMKTYEYRLSVGEKRIAKSLYSKWSKRSISSGHKNDLCKIGGCKERVLKVLKIRGYLEQKGDYYRIISEKFEEL